MLKKRNVTTINERNKMKSTFKKGTIGYAVEKLVEQTVNFNTATI